MPDHQRPPRIVLVHGTFARGAVWTQPSVSSLCASLRRSLGSDTQFDPFPWSGVNRHNARVEAGRDLADHLDTLLAETPRRPVFVIGHSHGGTVITHALRARPSLARSLSGVVLLSTPFIQVRRRPHATALGVLLASVSAFGAIWLIGQVNVWLTRLELPNWMVGLVMLALAVGTLSAWLSMLYETRPATQPGGKAEVVSRLDATVGRLREAFAVRHLRRERTLILRANADEASAALAWVQAVSRLLGDILSTGLRWMKAMLPWVAVEVHEQGRRPSGLVHWCAHAVGIALMVYLLAVAAVWLAGVGLGLLAIVTGMFGIDLRPAVAALLPAGADPVGFLAGAGDAIDGMLWLGFTTLMVGAAAVLAVAGLTLALFNRAFGHWFTWTAMFVEVSVEAAPPGRWTVRQFEPLDQTGEWDAGKGVALAHSLSYEDPRAQRVVTSWIRLRLRDEARPRTRVATGP